MSKNKNCLTFSARCIRPVNHSGVHEYQYENADTLRAALDEAIGALEHIAALGTYTLSERPYAETISRMQGEACRILKKSRIDAGKVTR